MHLRYVLPALVLGGALIAFPAAAGDRGHQQSGSQSSGLTPWSGQGSSSHQGSGDAWAGHGSSNHQSPAEAWASHYGTSNANHNSSSNPWSNHGRNSSGQQGAGAVVRTHQSDRHRDLHTGTTQAANFDWRAAHRNWSPADRRNWISNHSHNGQWNGNWNHGTRHTVNRASFHFSARDYRHFNHWEQDRWRHGHWHHGYHHGHNGWWWYLNGGWFFYTNPIYPYPLYLSDNVYYDDYYYDGGRHNDDYDDYSGQPASDGYWYYCRDPQGYYPDVRTCRSDWQRVSPRDHDQGSGGGYGNDDRDQGRYDNSPGDDRGYDNNGPDDRDGDDDGPDNDDDDNGPPDHH